MRGVNKVILLGTVGRDPEVRSLGASGSTVTSISLATSEAWKDKNTGQFTEQTEWHKIVFYGRLAEISGEYLRKGSKVSTIFFAIRYSLYQFLSEGMICHGISGLQALKAAS